MKKRPPRLTEFPQCIQKNRRTGWTNIRICCLILAFQVSLFSGALVNPSLATTQEASSHRIQTLEIQTQTGNIPKTLRFPLYEQESTQYFSAGLGQEERKLRYPAFPLKLVFVKGERAFLASVSVTIAKKDGTIFLKIPGEEVAGPWLFINIQTGTYIVSGIDSSGAVVKKTISIQTGKPIVVHFRWH